MSLSCIIIDDEPNAVSLLEMFIRQATQWELRGKCYNALEAIAFFKESTVDFVFLDINMPQLTGMELAALLPAETRIIFTTAYSEYAADSYGFQTIDYLLKPITLKRFLSAQQKVEAHFGRTGTHSAGSLQEYFFVKSGKVLRNILLSDILFFEGEKEYVRLVLKDEQVLLYKRLKDVESQLRPPFVRIHNSYIVNLRKILKIQDNHVYIGGRQIPVSEKYREHFMELIQGRMF